jgi:8-oxo-dGTP pyrophosphatase MutT (NUDIX family)
LSESKAAPPVPAATIVMLRDGDDGLEVFMVVRHHQIDFASGALVFPGGKADAQDFDPALAGLPRRRGRRGRSCAASRSPPSAKRSRSAAFCWPGQAGERT